MGGEVRAGGRARDRGVLGAGRAGIGREEKVERAAAAVVGLVAVGRDDGGLPKDGRPPTVAREVQARQGLVGDHRLRDLNEIYLQLGRWPEAVFANTQTGQLYRVPLAQGN